MNPLYDQLMRGRNPMQNMNPTQRFQNGSISPMAQKFANFAQNFRQMSQGISPQQYAQQMLNSGQMSQEQFRQLGALANQILGTNY